MTCIIIPYYELLRRQNERAVERITHETGGAFYGGTINHDSPETQDERNRALLGVLLPPPEKE